MAKKSKKDIGSSLRQLDDKTHIFGAGEVVDQKIVDTIENNFMPYAMSVIMSRAIPEIDGFKPSHRKILYMMYKMGLLTGARAKSAKIVGQVMQLNPHGDAAIYDTMVRLSKGYEALLHPYVDSKGNFGKAFSRDMMWAASRYTEAKLEKICAELFADIDKDTVDMVDNFDNSMKEPALLPVTFPSVLVNANTGIAVGMASSICSFNLEEVCKTTIELLRNPKFDVSETLKAPDFAGGGLLVYDKAAMDEIYNTGRGSFKVRARYSFDKSNSCIEITEIPPTTTSEAIIDKVIEKVKAGSLREISDIRDETDLSGLKITIDVKRGTDPDKLMKKLYASTPLQDSFSCNFNVLINGMPRVLGVRELLGEWIEFRSGCVRRRTAFDLKRATDRLHLLRGLEKILLDIDKAISIIRNTEEESEVVPNLMIGFRIDKIQAEYVAEIKLRHLNKEYILKRLQDIDRLEEAIKDLNDILENPKRIKQIIIYELKEVVKKYAKPRKTEIIYSVELEEETVEPDIPEYPVTVFFTNGGYFKKITPLSLRMSGTQKLKDGDEIAQTVETTNSSELLFFTNKCQVYKSRACDFDDTKASVLGDYVAAKLEMEEGELPVYMAVTSDYSGYMMFLFENGKAAKVSLDAYRTVTKRKKLIKAFSDKSPVAAVMQLAADEEIVVISSAGRHLLLNTAVILPKTTKDTIGVGVMTLKKGQRLMSARKYREGEFAKAYRYRAKNLPAAGALLSSEDEAEQMTFE
ncbi:MAG: DNA topoisomerase (ATP-hydrolyzing) subunit A [Oscillospiraceae bacterium]|nr:DNA topoisomerase (ATP-hydrolyzing) subunit A [Oscillospiraceae bacterium]